MQMQQIQQAFTASGVPLEESQRQGLLEIMKDERAKTPRNPLEWPAGNKNIASQFRAMQNNEAVDQLIKNGEDLNRRVLNRARTILTPDQMTTFETAQKQQLDMMQMGLKMSREMMKGK